MFDYSPRDFWEMTVAEAYMIIDAKTPEEMVGNISKSTFDELAAEFEEMEREGG